MDSGVPVRLCGDFISEWTVLWVGACGRRDCEVLWRVLIPGMGPAVAKPSVLWRTLIPGVEVLQALEVLTNIDGVGLSCG